MTCTASYTITQADLDCGLGDEHGHGACQRHGLEHATATVTAVAAPALTLVKTADAGDLQRGRRRDQLQLRW